MGSKSSVVASLETFLNPCTILDIRSIVESTSSSKLLAFSTSSFSEETIFFISLQDELMRIFGGDSIDGMLQKLGLKENESIDHPWINKAMERAQKKVESRNFDIRKTLIKFDDVMNDQRQVIFSQRLKILKEHNINDILKDFFDEVLINLNFTRTSFQKSGDEKTYLTETKNITGNIKIDEELLKLSKLKKNKFNFPINR